MATPQIQLRLYSASIGIPAGERPVIGEPFWDPHVGCFGVYNENNKINWYPSVIDDVVANRNVMRLHPDQALGGMIAESTPRPNNLVLDFSKGDEIQIRDRVSGEVYHRFTSTGAMFTSATVQGTTKLGLVNQVFNAGLNVQRTFGIPNPPRVTGASDGKRSLVVAPNWQLWTAPDRTGILEARLSNDVPFSNCPYAMEVSVPLTPVHAGLRTFLQSTTFMAGKKVNFSVYIKGPVGKTTYVRALSANGVLNSIVVTGTGQWERQSFVVDMPSRTQLGEAGANFIAFDMLYNPLGGEGVGSWFVAAPQVAFGSTPVDIDIRSGPVEKSLLQSVYSERKIRIKRGESTLLTWELQAGNNEYIQVEFDSSSTLPITITEKDHLGALLTVANTGNFDQWINVKVAAYRLPFLEESLGA